MRSRVVSEAVETSRRCARRCAAAAKVDPGGNGDARDHLTLLRDCADICNVVVKVLERESVFAVETAQLAAEACRTCAESCRSFGNESLAAECDATAEACRTFVVESTWRDAPVRAPHEVERPVH